MDRLPQSAGSRAQPCAKPSAPSYLYLNGNLYYFRIIVPRELRKHWGRKEIRLSLRTAHRRKARARAILLFAELSSAISGGNMLGLTEIRRRRNTLLQSLLEQEVMISCKGEALPFRTALRSLPANWPVCKSA